MEDIISKELLSEVLKHDFEIDFRYDMENNRIIIGDEKEGEDLYDINIYELAHKCKEWARLLGYEIITSSDFDLRHCKIEDYGTYCFTAYVNKKWESNTHLIDFNAETEPEAVFKACKWIFKNK